METENEVISVHEAVRLKADKSIIFLDVREDDEVAYCSIEGALHIPMGEINQRLEHLPGDMRIVVFCHHGMRSLHITRLLRARGYDKAQSMTGGIDAWSHAIDPSVPRY